MTVLADGLAGGLVGPVQVVGTGLLGTSVALACRRAGLDVLLSDADPGHVRTASGLGAGRPVAPGDRPQLVVVAVPPDLLGPVVADALATTNAFVTDVGSVKAAPAAFVSGGEGAERYVGGHPMAGTERSGPLTATASLFEGRPWAVTPHPQSSAEAISLVEALAVLCGAVPVRLSPEEHDRAVARISHVPHLMAVLTAGRLTDAPSEELELSGPGVRDVTRVAGGDPRLYSQIVGGNAVAVSSLLREVRAELDALIGALDGGDRSALEALLTHGRAGVAALPAKHGGPARPSSSVFVAIPDEPGVLARLFADVGASGVNVEDLHIDHDLGREVGHLELVVNDASAEALVASLESRGWATHR